MNAGTEKNKQKRIIHDDDAASECTYIFLPKCVKHERRRNFCVMKSVIGATDFMWSWKKTKKI
jgi:hypothetical protein